jgi:oligopeptide/dipeptide ABC transporter ATP-binding protein
VIFRDPRHPYTQALIATMPRVDRSYSREGRTRLVVIPGRIPNLIEPPSGCRFHPRCPKAVSECSVTLPEPVEVAAGHRVSCLLQSREPTAESRHEH